MSLRRMFWILTTVLWAAAPPLGAQSSKSFLIGSTSRPGAETNWAGNRAAWASSSYKSNNPLKALDNDGGSRWESEWGIDPQWWAVDLGRKVDVRSVRIEWEPAYSKTYRIEASDDGTTWKTVHRQEQSSGKVDTLPVRALTRYLRLFSEARATEWGVSFWEFQVFGSSEGPTAVFQGSDASPLVGEKVVFDAAKSHYAGHKVSGYRWDFGDGTRKTGPTVSHEWSKEGTYLVILTVVGDDGLEGIQPYSVTVRSITPVAALRQNPQVGVPGEDTLFSASSSRANLGELVDWQWDFGDGTKGQGIQVSHSYRKTGRYPVRLTVKDSQGRTNTLTRDYLVETGFAPPLKVEGSKILDAAGKVVVLRGFAIYDPWNLNEADIENYKVNWNVNVVRLAMGTGRCWYETDPVKQNAYLEATDRVLQWCLDRNIYVVLDGFHESGNSGNVDFHYEMAKKAWKVLAPRYADQPHILWEVYNEPYEIGWSPWVDVATELVDIIRSANPLVTACIVPGVTWAQHAFPERKKVERPEIIYSFHPYAHVYDRSWTKETWDEHIGYIVTKGIAPVFCGEWAYWEPGLEKEYAEPLVKFFDDNGISHTYWGYFPGWGNNLVDNERGDPEKPSYAGVFLKKYLEPRKPWN